MRVQFPIVTTATPKGRRSSISTAQLRADEHLRGAASLFGLEFFNFSRLTLAREKKNEILREQLQVKSGN